MGGGDISAARCSIQGNEVDLGAKPRKNPCQPPCILISIVDAVDQDILKGDHPPIRKGKLSASLNETTERISPVDGHETASRLVIGRVQRHCQIDRCIAAQLLDFRDQNRRWRGVTFLWEKFIPSAAIRFPRTLTTSIIIGKGARPSP